MPKHILSSDEAERILNVPDVTTPPGIRDRALLETLYSTGMRRMELIGLMASGPMLTLPSPQCSRSLSFKSRRKVPWNFACCWLAATCSVSGAGGAIRIGRV